MLPKALERYIETPYGGLFGNSVRAKVVEEIVADPLKSFRPKDLERMSEASSPSVRRALGTLTTLGLLLKDTSDRQHPIYGVNLDSKKLKALTFLSLAVLDDRDGTNCMEDAIVDYCRFVLKEKVQPAAFATAVKYEYHGLAVTETKIIQTSAETPFPEAVSTGG